MVRIPLLSAALEEIDDALQYADPRTKGWFMLFENPIPVWIVTALYMALVFLGPAVMRNRKPFVLQGPMFVYNVFLVILSTYMSVELLLSTSAAEYKWLCSPYNQDTWKNPKELRVAEILYIYGLSKTLELLDTVFMILRKKNEQVSFLHVFHHMVMLNIWWWVPTFIPGGQTWFGVWMNCNVHVVMYLYYALAAIPSLRGKLWWKRYLTKFQLIQFCITLSHSLQTYYTGCDFPFWGQVLLNGFMVALLILFGNFYLQQYIKGKRHDKKTDTNGHVKPTGNGVSNGVKHVNGTNGSTLASRNSLRSRENS